QPDRHVRALAGRDAVRRLGARGLRVLAAAGADRRGSGLRAAGPGAGLLPGARRLALVQQVAGHALAMADLSRGRAPGRAPLRLVFRPLRPAGCRQAHVADPPPGAVQGRTVVTTVTVLGGPMSSLRGFPGAARPMYCAFRIPV